MIGQVFGRLTVLSIAHQGIDRHRFWNCRCECGNQCVADGANMRSNEKRGRVSSCGCYKMEILLSIENRNAIPRELQCKQCGNKFTVETSREARTRNYCSLECHNDARSSDGRGTAFSDPTGERLAEQRARLARLGREVTEEWARMAAAGYRRTDSSVDAPESERWVKDDTEGVQLEWAV